MDELLPGLYVVPNLHPLMVHFPVALWPVALLALTYAYLRKDEHAYRFGSALLYLGVAAGLGAALTGWLAAEALGHDAPGHELVHDHRDLMLAACLLALAAAGAAHACRSEARRRARWIPLGLLLIACLLTALGADRGALLVYGHGVGVRALGDQQARAAPSGSPSHDDGHSH